MSCGGGYLHVLRPQVLDEEEEEVEVGVGEGEGERGEDTREWRRTSALCLINQPGSGPAGFPASTFPPLLSLALSLSSRDGGPGLRIIPGAPQHRQGWPRIPGAKGLITPAHRSEHPGAMETRLGGDEGSSKRFPSSQEANNRFMLPPRWTSPRSGVGHREHSGRSAR